MHGWILRRPSNPEKMFANLSFSQPSEAADAITQLKWLAEYLDYDSNIIKKRFISSAPEHLQPLLLSRSSGKLDAIVDFVLQCPDTSSSIFGAVSKDAISNNSSRKYDKKCGYCGRSNHSFENCRRRLHLCLGCGSSDHFVNKCEVKKRVIAAVTSFATAACVPLSIYGNIVQCRLDSGSPVSFVSRKYVEKHALPLRKVNKSFIAIDGKPFIASFMVDIDVLPPEWKIPVTLPFFVIDSSIDILLGEDSLSLPWVAQWTTHVVLLSFANGFMPFLQ